MDLSFAHMVRNSQAFHLRCACAETWNELVWTHGGPSLGTESEEWPWLSLLRDPKGLINDV